MGYERKSTYPVSKIFPFIKKGKAFNLDGDWINPSSRYRLFFLKGTKCVVCGLNGTYFAKEKTRGTAKFHLNLYGKNTSGQEVMLTKDHIIPKSKGGANHHDNYQTMCAVCNQKKGNTHPDDPQTDVIVRESKKEKGKIKTLRKINGGRFTLTIGKFRLSRTPINKKVLNFILPRKVDNTYNKNIKVLRWGFFNFSWKMS